MLYPRLSAAFVSIAMVLFSIAVPLFAENATVRFKKIQLDDKFRAEGVAVGDFNNDGKLDIAAGPVWYAAPDWKMHTIYEKPKQEYDPKGYSDCFNCWADDLNGNGWADVIQITWPGKEAVWFENPQGQPGPWKRYVATPVASNESPQYADIDGSGRRALVIGFASGNPDGPDRRMGIARPDKDPYKPWIIQPISEPAAPSTQRYAHGLGVGDVNGNGRKDVVVPQGWWEHPAETAASPWKFHPAPLGQPCADMHVLDLTGNGRGDVLSSSAHAYGIWWHEQLDDGKWRTHEIDKTFSQTHSLCVADINGDGLMDFVTGKRWWAHGPTGDPGSGEPAVLHWFELKRTGGRPEWIRHQIDHDSGVGTQFQVADVNGNGLLDIVIANKKGVFLFEQVRE